MISKFKHKINSFNSTRARKKLLTKIEHKLFNVKGFHLKELFLAQDNLSAIAIDKSGRSLNLISVEKNEIKTCLVQFSDLFAVEMFMRGKSYDKLSRKTALTQNQQQIILSDTLTAHLKDTFPKSSKVLCLHTSKKSTPLFVIDFQLKSSNSEANPVSDFVHQNKAARKKAIHWLDMCKRIIEKGEQKAMDSSYHQTFKDTDVVEFALPVDSLEA